MRQSIVVGLFAMLFCGCQVCGCKSSKTQAEPKLRDGVMDLPIDTAPQELRIAADVWQQSTSSVAAVVSTLNDKSRRATYYFDIGFEGSDWKSKRETFHRRLLDTGWKLSDERQHHAGSYAAKGRQLHVGFDTGMHPTTLVVSYERESTQPTDSPDSE